MKKTIILICILAIYGFVQNSKNNKYKFIFEESWKIVNERFYDYKFGGIDWKKTKDKYKHIQHSKTDKEFISFRIFMQNSVTICHQAIIKGFSHGTFTDLALFKPGGESDIKLQRELILTFFDIYLKNDKSKDLKELENKYNRIILRSNNKKSR